VSRERPPTYLAGAGAVTGYGWGFDALVAGLRSGVTAARADPVRVGGAGGANSASLFDIPRGGIS
jgi:hypothetical protein